MLKATQITGTLTDGAPVSTATGVYVYVVMAGVLFALAVVPSIMLTRHRPVTPSGYPKKCSSPVSSSAHESS